MQHNRSSSLHCSKLCCLIAITFLIFRPLPVCHCTKETDDLICSHSNQKKLFLLVKSLFSFSAVLLIFGFIPNLAVQSRSIKCRQCCFLLLSPIVEDILNLDIISSILQLHVISCIQKSHCVPSFLRKSLYFLKISSSEQIQGLWRAALETFPNIPVAQGSIRCFPVPMLYIWAQRWCNSKLFVIMRWIKELCGNAR